MNKLNIFIAAPISGFTDASHYAQYRISVLRLITILRKKNWVFSEIEKFATLGSYDDPKQSALKDFDKITKSDVFVLVHPARMQSSSMIELGYAIAKGKKIIIISQKSNLPFLALGLFDAYDNVKLVESASICDISINKVLSFLDNWQQ